ncbi:type IV secretion system protein [soil metagenome]
MKPDKPPLDRSAYYAEAASWSQDVYGALRASRRVAWIIAAGAGAVALLEAVALAGLMPLKTVVPYTITVDRQTGYVEAAQGLRPGTLSQDAAVTQAFLAQYVLAREGFDPVDLQSTYRKVALWSAGDARNQYVRAMSASNPGSPLKAYSPTTVVQPVIKSISLLSSDTALVRFESERRESGAVVGDRAAFASVIKFRYTGAPMRMGDRFLNPLGFQVTSYRRDSEMIGSSATSQGIR